MLLIVTAAQEAPICTVMAAVRCAEPDVAVTVTVDVTGWTFFEAEPQPVRAIEQIARASLRDSH
ncbi:MAG TPA: hypothetical protein VHD85_02095 [Terracidiphilus sp.]|nr:hypothetical protein [Terracidiphilus sp.]